MNALVQPLHVAAVGLGNLRMFRAPFDEPHMPWHSPEDLLRGLVLDRKFRRMHLARMVAQWPNEVRTVRTTDGRTLIASHITAQGFIGAMRDHGKLPLGFDDAYTKAFEATMSKLTDGMSPLDNVNFCVEAFRRTNHMPGPHPKLGPEAIVHLPRKTGGGE